MKGLCILGSTGSVGCNTLRVVSSLPTQFRVVALAAGRNLETLAHQVADFSPAVVVVADDACIEPLQARLEALGHCAPVRILAGTAGQVEAATVPEVDFVVSACHGVTGLAATYAAVRAGKQIGLASKEVMVVAGKLVTDAAHESGATILPIDSEHSAIHQCLRSGEPGEIKRLILTASGGPFLRTARKSFASITPEQALRHPVWKMGGRITVDSATLMNKALEVIEAHWLFGLPSEQIEVLIHPESVVHSMVEFVDGSIVAQLSVADMRIPIQYALTYPDRVALNGGSLSLDLLKVERLSFRKPDDRRFPCLKLGREALLRGEALACVLNAADEVAVEAFRAGQLRFVDIPTVVEGVMASTESAQLETLDKVLEFDRESRRRAWEMVEVIAGPTSTCE
jgi:1-deoxy-D-xylulose-5-phosphate reductoisomerase